MAICDEGEQLLDRRAREGGGEDPKTVRLKKERKWNGRATHLLSREKGKKGKDGFSKCQEEGMSVSVKPPFPLRRRPRKERGSYTALEAGGKRRLYQGKRKKEKGASIGAGEGGKNSSQGGGKTSYQTQGRDLTTRRKRRCARKSWGKRDVAVQ